MLSYSNAYIESRIENIVHYLATMLRTTYIANKIILYTKEYNCNLILLFDPHIMTNFVPLSTIVQLLCQNLVKI